MIRGCLSIIGLVLLVAGAAFLFAARGPQAKKTVEVGGKTITQQEVAAQTFGGEFSEEVPPDLPVTIDGVDSTTNQVAAAPEISGGALSDMSVAQSAEQVDAPISANDTVITESIEVETIPLELSTATITSDITGQGGAGFGGVYEQRVVELEYPRSFRVKGNANIRLTLRALPSGQIEAVPEIADNAIIATPILLTDLYDTHFATFTARLEAADMGKIQLLTSQTQVANRGEEVTWRWNVTSPDKSKLVTLLFIVEVRWDPKPGAAVAPIGQRTVWSQAIQVDVNYVFGIITVPQASIAGTALALVGLFAEIPTGTAILTWLVTRSRRPRRRSTNTRSRSRSRR